MGANVTDGILDASLDAIAACNRITVLSAEPTSIADITTTYKLATAAMVAGDGNDYAIANGDTSGRKVTTAQKAGVNIDSSGSATHIALDDGTDFITTTCTTKALTASDTTTIPAYDVEIQDPVAS